MLQRNGIWERISAALFSLQIVIDCNFNSGMIVNVSS